MRDAPREALRSLPHARKYFNDGCLFGVGCMDGDIINPCGRLHKSAMELHEDPMIHQRSLELLLSLRSILFIGPE